MGHHVPEFLKHIRFDYIIDMLYTRAINNIVVCIAGVEYTISHSDARQIDYEHSQLMQKYFPVTRLSRDGESIITSLSHQIDEPRNKKIVSRLLCKRYLLKEEIDDDILWTVPITPTMPLFEFH